MTKVKKPKLTYKQQMATIRFERDFYLELNGLKKFKDGDEVFVTARGRNPMIRLHKRGWEILSSNPVAISGTTYRTDYIMLIKRPLLDAYLEEAKIEYGIPA